MAIGFCTYEFMEVWRGLILVGATDVEICVDVDVACVSVVDGSSILYSSICWVMVFGE